jgi:hypothetical protein
MKKGFVSIPVIIIVAFLLIILFVFIKSDRIKKGSSETSRTNQISSKPSLTIEKSFDDNSDFAEIIESHLDNKWEIHPLMIANSPTDRSIVAFAAVSFSEKQFAIFTYNSNNLAIEKIWSEKAIGSGRSGYYADNEEFGFSPDGNFIYLNETANAGDEASFLLINVNGEVLYKSSKDPGYPTWLNENEVLFLSHNYNNPIIYNTQDRSIKETNIPLGHHYKANGNGKYVYFYHHPSEENPSICNNFDLGIAELNSENVIKTINDVYLNSVRWLNGNTLEFKTVTECKYFEDTGYPNPELSANQVVRF